MPKIPLGMYDNAFIHLVFTLTIDDLDIDIPLFYIVFNNDYSKFQVYDGKLKPRGVEITLLNG